MEKLTVQQDIIDKAPRVNMGRRELLLGLAAGTVIPLTAGCETGDVGQFLVSDSQIQQASAAAWSQALQQERVSRDPAQRRRVERVGNRLVPYSGLSNLNWEFVVFESDAQNAWVLPGGKVAFYRGILDTMTNDDQVAAVMGHEIAHLHYQHATQRARQQAAAGVGLAVINVGLGAAEVQNADRWAGILGAGVTFGVLLPYSRNHELQADLKGVDYMHQAGYRPSQALAFWTAKAAQNQRQQIELLSTHPSSSTRISALRQHIQERGYA
jgi:predicted Zn-dependent protease